jgi:FkbM family methyltransferase
MLIPLRDLVGKYGLHLTGVLHVGAHQGEENNAYLEAGVAQSNIYWVDAIPELCTALATRLPNVIHAAVSDEVVNAEFKVTNNFQSSSLLDLKDHLREHPDIYVTRTIQLTTIKLDTIVEEHGIRANFLNMDIQGAELKCLKGFERNLGMIDIIYTEVNASELYAGCVLLKELDEWLDARGFERRDIAMTSHGWGDALYLRKA